MPDAHALKIIGAANVSDGHALQIIGAAQDAPLLMAMVLPMFMIGEVLELQTTKHRMSHLQSEILPFMKGESLFPIVTSQVCIRLHETSTGWKSSQD